MIDLCDEITSSISGKVKRAPNGFITFNGPCCIHNGEPSNDTRGRAGLRPNGDGFFYHCFNCRFSISWEPGKLLNHRLENFLTWLNIDTDRIKFLKYKCWHLQQQMELKGIKFNNIVPNITIPTFQKVDLPKKSKSISYWLNNPTPEFEKVLMWLYDRDECFLDKYNFYWSPEKTSRINESIIIPFVYNKEIVGYSLRAAYETKNRYLNYSQPGYIFNNEVIYSNRGYVFVTEGPFDAIAIDGVSLLGNKCSEQQNEWLKSSDKEIVLVPDRDDSGLKLIDKALLYGWSVSFPNWDIKVKDCAESVKKYGRLWTLKTIIESIERNQLKIQNKSKLLLTEIDATTNMKIKEKNFSEKMRERLMRSSFSG